MPWEPQPGPQASAILADWCDEIFYGGERGGGKSDFQLGYQEDAALRYDGKSRGIVLRKTYPELEELQARAMEMFTASGAVYKTQPSEQYPFSNCWYWPNGASVKMRYIEHERDYGRYHGQQYSHISLDEVTEYPTPVGMQKMLSTMRNAHGVPCSIRLTGNPGGVGHGWVRERYIVGKEPYVPYVDSESGLARMFIPSKTSDNRILLQSDPQYRKRIVAATAGNDVLRRAWLGGEWNIVAGAFFDCWRQSSHVIDPFDLPRHWLRFRAMDWGSARPFSVGWWAVVGDDHRIGGLVLRRGCLVRYREWYGAAKDDSGATKPNVGLKLSVEEVAAGIRCFERGERIAYGVIDPACFSSNGGPSIAETMARHGVAWQRADNKRVTGRGALGGWAQMRSRLIGLSEGEPMLVCFKTCVDSIRTIPMLVHDTANIEDLDTNMEDHAADEWRYACMSRPWAVSEPQRIEAAIKPFITIGDYIKAGTAGGREWKRI